MDGRFDYISLIICIGTLAGNVILNVGILVAPFIDREVRRKRYAVLVSLAFVDLLKIIPLISEIGFPSHEPRTCLAFASVGLYLICVTVLHLVLESINRLVAIVRPLRYNELLTSKLFASLMAALWLLPIFGIILPLAVNADIMDWIPSLRALMFNCDQFYDIPTDNNGTQNLHGTDGELIPIQFKPVDASMAAYSVVITIAYFAIPLIIMVIAYSVIFSISLKHIRQIKGMEKNMRQLYHRISRHELISAPISCASISVESPEHKFEARYPYRIITEVDKNNEPPSSRNDKAEGDYYEVENSLTMDLVDHPAEEIKSPATVIKNHDIEKASRIAEEKITQDGRKTNDIDKSKRKRKASNVVHPHDNSAKIPWNGNVVDEQLKTDYAELSRDYLPFNNLSEDKQELIEPFVDASKERRHSLIPVQAVDVMESEYESVIASNILIIDEREGENTEIADKAVADTVVIESARSGKGENAAKIKNEYDDVFVEDSSDGKNKKEKEITFDDPRHSVNEEISRIRRANAWSQMWMRIAKKSEATDGRREKKDRIPSERAFIKLIEAAEKKTKPSTHSFERNARRVMRYSALLNSRRRAVEQDEDIGERPTHAEVNRMESLLSIADKEHNDQITSALNRNIHTSSSGNQSQSMDAFSLLTAFPVMEAWANSVKAKATPQSNSFVRFYRVIRSEMRNRKKEGKLIKTLGILFMAWILFYVPVVAYSWNRLVRWPVVAENDHGSSRLLISWAMLSSALNPIIYCFRISEFKKTFKKIYKAVKDHLYCR